MLKSVQLEPNHFDMGTTITSILHGWTRCKFWCVLSSSPMISFAESVPEMGYDALYSGHVERLPEKNMVSGYHKRQELTEEVLIDDWFHKGDICNGSLMEQRKS